VTRNRRANSDLPWEFLQEPADSLRLRELGELEDRKMSKRAGTGRNRLRKGSLKVKGDIRGIARIRRSKKIGPTNVEKSSRKVDEEIKRLQNNFGS
jgi:hypothetical protein